MAALESLSGRRHAPAQQFKIVRYGHPALRENAQRVGRVTREVKELVAHMAELMRAAGGLGLAANQVGVARRVAVVEVEGKLTPLVNPELVSAKGSEPAEEGCLSLPRLYGMVARPTQVVVKARDLTGKQMKLRAEGLLARALCHEIDHLGGKLFVDKVDESTLHWLVGETTEGEPVIQPTTLEEALKVFVAAGGRDEL
jgi:peptide deformylase